MLRDRSQTARGSDASRRRGPLRIAALAAVACLALIPASADAAQSTKKAIWGPVGAAHFTSDYCPLGVGIYQAVISWPQVAPTKPADPANPNDPAYQWSSDLDTAITAAQSCGIKVSLMLIFTPKWANGGKAINMPPNSAADFARFARAAAARYPSVRLWQIWGEPTRRSNWGITKRTRRLKLTRKQRRSPRRYAALLDAAYGSLHAANSSNQVIGGMTLTRGDILPLAWIRYMRLPNGRRPRFDMYGHNPFTARNPNLKKRPLQKGTYDFSDLDSLAKAIDRHLKARGRKIFVSEWTVPSDFTTREFLGFYVSRATQAKWLRSALRIARGWNRLYTVGWFQLPDTPASQGGPIGWGLRTAGGTRKPSWFAYRDG